jgi:hypothetical protein
MHCLFVARRNPGLCEAIFPHGSSSFSKLHNPTIHSEIGTLFEIVPFRRALPSMLEIGTITDIL